MNNFLTGQSLSIYLFQDRFFLERWEFGFSVWVCLSAERLTQGCRNKVLCIVNI